MERQSTPTTFRPKQVARAISVSEASIKRWCDKGVLAFSKTAGGHRRINLPAVLDFIRANDIHLAQPEVLGLPANVEAFIGAYQRLYDHCLAQQCAVVLGGRAVTESLRQHIQYASFGDNLQHLRAFAQNLCLVR